MKRIIYGAVLSLMLAHLAVAQPSPGYTNFGNVTSPINIDALDFVNLGLFNFSLEGLSADPFDFSDVLTYTNRGTMADDTGFQFDTAIPSRFGNPTRQPALVFANQNPGQIYGAAEFPINNNNVTLFTGITPPLLIVSANIMTNTGVLDVGQSGLISLIGQDLDLRRGEINVEGLGQLEANGGGANGVLVGGQFDVDWGLGPQTNVFSASIVATLVADAASEIESPTYKVTNSAGTSTSENLEIENAVIAAYTNIVSPSNNITQFIIAGDSLGEVALSVGFDTNQSANAAVPVVQWLGVTTGNSGAVITNQLFLEDGIALLTNITLLTNSTSLAGLPLLIPTNYEFLSTFTDSLIPSNAAVSTSLLADAFQGRQNETNFYTALDVNMDSVTFEPDSTIPGSTYSNVPGRVEITATGSLDLSNATLNAANFLNLNVSNFIGNPTASVSFSRATLNLGSTTGKLTLTNLVPPTVPLFSGPIGCYSAIWSNITRATNVTTVGTNTPVTNAFNVTNIFTVLMVSSELQPSSPVFLEDLMLNSTNLVISDTLEVVSNFLANAENITITTNGPGALSPYGLLELESVDSLWTPYLPSLQNLTNEGLIDTVNNAFFETRHSLNGPSANDAPLQSFVNTGVVEGGGGNTIWANFFENVGPNSVLGVTEILSEVGPIFVQSPTAIFANSDTVAEQGDMQITAGALVLSDEVLEATGSLTLYATNFLTDGGPTGTSLTCGDGFSIPVLPIGGAASNSLRGTTINNSCLPGLQSENVWAGRASLNLSASGLTNVLPAMSSNAPIGHLILTGESDGSVFHFAGADPVTPYVIYVDLLDLEGGAINRESVGGTNVFTALNVDTNVTIYFLDAETTNGVDISEKLNGANGGRLIWVSNYVGEFSSTNITFPDGNTFQFNRGLALSLTIDSNSNGLVNGIDPEPFFEPVTAEVLKLTAAPRTIGGSPYVEVSWTAPAYSTNTLEYLSMPATNWQVWTNFVQGPADGIVMINDPVQDKSRQYRLQVKPLQ